MKRSYSSEQPMQTKIKKEEKEEEHSSPETSGSEDNEENSEETPIYSVDFEVNDESVIAYIYANDFPEVLEGDYKIKIVLPIGAKFVCCLNPSVHVQESAASEMSPVIIPLEEIVRFIIEKDLSEFEIEVESVEAKGDQVELGILIKIVTNHEQP